MWGWEGLGAALLMVVVMAFIAGGVVFLGGGWMLSHISLGWH